MQPVAKAKYFGPEYDSNPMRGEPLKKIDIRVHRLSSGIPTACNLKRRASLYQAKLEFSLGQLQGLIELGLSDWILKNHSFSQEVSEKLKQYLQSPGCKIHSIKFVNCIWTPSFAEFFCAGLAENTSVSALHIEGGIFSKQIGETFKRALTKGCYLLQKIYFTNGTLSPHALDEIVQGIVAQNTHVDRAIAFALEESNAKVHFFHRVCRSLGINTDENIYSLNDVNELLMEDRGNPQIDKVDFFKELLEKAIGVKLLCLAGCRLYARHGKALKRLISKSSKLRELDLRHNLLGSLEDPSGKAVLAMVDGLEVNRSLHRLILSSCRISISDWAVLYQVVMNTKRLEVAIDLTNNYLKPCMVHERILLN